MSVIGNNVSPDLADRDRNLSADVFFSPASARLDYDASGWLRAGSMAPATYNATQPTGTNKTQLGTVRQTKNIHINSQDAQITGTWNELTPFGAEIANKSTINMQPVYATSGFTSTTIAAGGASVQLLTLSTTASLATGAYLSIPVPYGSGTKETFRYVESITGSAVYLEHPLDEAPSPGATVQRVARILQPKGGKTMRRYGFLAVLSGDDDTSQLIHHVPDTYVTDSTMTAPADNIAQRTFTLDLRGFNRTIDGKKEPLLFDEIFIP